MLAMAMLSMATGVKRRMRAPIRAMKKAASVVADGAVAAAAVAVKAKRAKAVKPVRTRLAKRPLLTPMAMQTL